ncbi:MAG: glycosyltransferase [Rhodobacteraceae bacterium]|nr:glycosyltransferase [Paracoccaceae bacterium]
MTHIAYFSVIALLFAAVPMGYLGDLQDMTKTLFIVGFLGIWRYTWALTNFSRAFLYRFWAWPRRRKAYHKAFADSGAPSHMYVMITSYMVDPEVTLMVYRRLLAACANARDGATIVASVVDGADERLIRQIYDSSREDLSNTRLVIDRIKANGKRDAMMKALRILARFHPTRHDIMVFIDGDTAPPPDLWAQSAPIFSDPQVGALTTDEAALIDEAGLFRDWFDLRFHQRNVMMSSMGLSKRVLTLTGRLSVFRASLATDPGFIRGVGQDYLDHWRLGRVDFLTGDDKSTWYWLLTNGYQTIYLPDVQSESVETQPKPGFVDSAKTLMIRWFGNMMRTNGRALRQSPRRIGYFTWWSILDQKVSMWTTLVGPMSVLFTAILHSAWVIPLYIGWVMLTRYVFCVVIALFNGAWFPVTHPPVLYFGQVFGAMLKTYVFFRLDRQKWTRQASSSGGATTSLFDRVKQMESVAHHVVAVSFLALAILFLNTVE